VNIASIFFLLFGAVASTETDRCQCSRLPDNRLRSHACSRTDFATETGPPRSHHHDLHGDI